MNISLRNKLKVLVKALKQTKKLPSARLKARHLLCPVDSTRYTEFAFLLCCMQVFNINIKSRKILDVSSPFVLSYILSDNAITLKTDINLLEKKYIKESKTLSFKQEDATNLSFKDESFDFVYSVSAIEHIYERYGIAVSEMLRVLRPGGYLYFTFPVAKHHTEEWLDTPIYSHQYTRDGQVFFQYRFDEEDVEALLKGIENAFIISYSIYWEKHNGAYDRLVAVLKKGHQLKFIYTLFHSLMNLWTGFNMLEITPSNFTRARSFGNASILLHKKL